MQKTYVLDTNILIQAPYALESFEDNHIVLPLAVLEAMDELQQAEGEQGGNARQVIRFLEQLRLKGNLVEGVALQGVGSGAAEAGGGLDGAGRNLCRTQPVQPADGACIGACPPADRPHAGRSAGQAQFSAGSSAPGQTNSRLSGQPGKPISRSSWIIRPTIRKI